MDMNALPDSIRPRHRGEYDEAELDYNLAITGLSVAICFVIGVVEALSLLPQEIHGLSRTTGFWGLISRFNINTAGFVIVGLFLATWLAALLIWRYARIEQKWNPAPSGTPGGAGCRGTSRIGIE